ncbi:MAG TPA: ABC transporter substrate-binding protein [Solirubrobacterales bacterium]|nr:ABC transporter substrate-binding protein [Solirubrobacterales bacterium]
MTYTDIETEGPTQKKLSETARVYGEWVNAHGGIGGHPLEVTICDAHGTPTGAAACGREAISDGVVATVGNFTFTGDAIVPILESGDVAQFGNCCSVSPLEMTSKISFPLGNGPLIGPATVKSAVEEGCKSINAVVIEGGETYETLMVAAAKSLGVKLNKIVSLPATPTDYSPQVAEATSDNADCIAMVIAETTYPAWMTAFAQSGSEAKLIGVQGNFSEAVVKGFESIVSGDVVTGMFSDISAPVWNNYRDALKEYNADPGLEYNGLGGMGTWAAYEAFKQVVESIQGEVNNETFLKAAATAKINLPGMVPPLDFSKPWEKTGGPSEFGRLVNRCGINSVFNSEGKLETQGSSFEDLSELVGGTQPMNCGKPFET